MKETGPSKPKGGFRKQELKSYFSQSALGLEIGIALAIGLLIGWYLDRLFDTQPLFLIIFMIFGIIAGFRNVVRLAQKDWSKEDDGPGKQ